MQSIFLRLSDVQKHGSKEINEHKVISQFGICLH